MFIIIPISLDSSIASLYDSYYTISNSCNQEFLRILESFESLHAPAIIWLVIHAGDEGNQVTAVCMEDGHLGGEDFAHREHLVGGCAQLSRVADRITNRQRMNPPEVIIYTSVVPCNRRVSSPYAGFGEVACTVEQGCTIRALIDVHVQTDGGNGELRHITAAVMEVGGDRAKCGGATGGDCAHAHTRRGYRSGSDRGYGSLSALHKIWREQLTAVGQVGSRRSKDRRDERRIFAPVGVGGFAYVHIDGIVGGGPTE